MTITRSVPGKINLFLEVLGNRPDGYHELRTVFLPVDELRDEVTVSLRADAGLEVVCEHPGVPDGEGNICWRAALAFAEAAACEPRWRIGILKRIPVAAGLGGGSADAAATLLALNQLQGEALDQPTLHRLAAKLGADVPFFLASRPALGEGIGDRLGPVPLGRDLGLVLVNPGFPVPVAWSYANLNRVPRPPAPDCAALLEALAAGDMDGIAAGVHNDLEYAVRDKFPLVEILRSRLLDAGCAAVAVSGSGPTLFGLTPGEPGSVAATLRAEFAGEAWIRTAWARRREAGPGEVPALG